MPDIWGGCKTESKHTPQGIRYPADSELGRAGEQYLYILIFEYRLHSAQLVMFDDSLSHFGVPSHNI